MAIANLPTPVREIEYPDGECFKSFVETAQEADKQRTRAEREHQRAEQLEAKLRALGVDPNTE